MNNFTSPIGLYFKLIGRLQRNPKGYVFGAVTDNVKKYVYEKYVNKNKCNYKLIKLLRELKRESKESS